MKKYYKVKEVNKTKLKRYLTNADTKNSTRHTRSCSSKWNSTERNNVQ